MYKRPSGGYIPSTNMDLYNHIKRLENKLEEFEKKIELLYLKLEILEAADKPVDCIGKEHK